MQGFNCANLQKKRGDYSPLSNIIDIIGRENKQTRQGVKFIRNKNGMIQKQIIIE